VVFYDLRVLTVQTSIRQIEAELDLSYRMVRRRVERVASALDEPSFTLSSPVKIDEEYVSAGLKGRDRDQKSRSRDLSTRGRGSYEEDTDRYSSWLTAAATSVTLSQRNRRRIDGSAPPRGSR